MLPYLQLHPLIDINATDRDAVAKTAIIPDSNENFEAVNESDRTFEKNGDTDDSDDSDDSDYHQDEGIDKDGSFSGSENGKDGDDCEDSDSDSSDYDDDATEAWALASTAKHANNESTVSAHNLEDKRKENGCKQRDRH